VASLPEPLQVPVACCGHEYRIGLSLDLHGLCAVHEGIELGSLQGRLGLLPREGAWSYPLRRIVVPLSEGDARLITEQLEPLLRPVSEVLRAYESAARPLDVEEIE
jgi:hypothetical protein